jgi:hypothetical protein
VWQTVPADVKQIAIPNSLERTIRWLYLLPKAFGVRAAVTQLAKPIAAPASWQQLFMLQTRQSLATLLLHKVRLLNSFFLQTQLSRM